MSIISKQGEEIMTTLLEFRNTKYRYDPKPGFDGRVIHFQEDEYETWSYENEETGRIEYHREDGPARIDPDNMFEDERSCWYLHGYHTTWKHVFAAAAGDVDKESRIVANYLVYGDTYEEAFMNFERERGRYPVLGKKVVPWDETRIHLLKTPDGMNWWEYISTRYHQINYESEGCGIKKIRRKLQNKMWGIQ